MGVSHVYNCQKLLAAYFMVEDHTYISQYKVITGVVGITMLVTAMKSQSYASLFSVVSIGKVIHY